MVKKAIKSLLARFGYELHRISAGQENGNGYALCRFQRPDGSFDYERYRRTQTEGNRKKLGCVWVQEPNIEFLATYIRNTIGTPSFGLCHGTRRGLEQQWFRKYLGCEVIGTEISDTANQFAHTIQWDFHETKPEWIDAVDFIYSNSFDHSYDPKKCLGAWMSCVRPGGICILEHSVNHTPGHVTELDPFGAELHVLPYLISLWAEGKYVVRQILKRSAPQTSPDQLSFIVIQRLDDAARDSATLTTAGAAV